MGTTEIKPGDCFFNVARFSCLRVKRVYEAHVQGVGCPPEGHKVWYADAMTWRPDGSKGSNLVKVRLDSLTKTPYWRMEAVRVYAGGKSFEFELTDKPEPICPQIDQSLVEEIESEVRR
jgi:hypothetical protein